MKVYGVFLNDMLCLNTCSLAIYDDYVSADMYRLTRENLLPELKHSIREMELDEVLK